jgi:hypothetical protein
MLLYKSIHQGYNLYITLMEGLSVKTIDIRFVKDYSISVAIFEIQHLRGTKRKKFSPSKVRVLLQMCVYSFKSACTPSNVRVLLQMCVYSFKCACNPSNVRVLLQMCVYSFKCAYTPSNVRVLLQMCVYSFKCAYSPSNVRIVLQMCVYSFKCACSPSNVRVLLQMCVYSFEHTFSLVESLQQSSPVIRTCHVIYSAYCRLHNASLITCS